MYTIAVFISLQGENSSNHGKKNGTTGQRIGERINITFSLHIFQDNTVSKAEQ
jgi:hypothetical protein